jgi:hypothetical protein
MTIRSSLFHKLKIFGNDFERKEIIEMISHRPKAKVACQNVCHPLRVTHPCEKRGIE